MYALKTANTTTLLWMERGQVPNEVSFESTNMSSAISHHVDIGSAVAEAMRKMADGSSGGRQPWMLYEGIVFEPAELQMFDNQAAEMAIDAHLARSPDAIRRYYAEWGR